MSFPGFNHQTHSSVDGEGVKGRGVLGPSVVLFESKPQNYVPSLLKMYHTVAALQMGRKLEPVILQALEPTEAPDIRSTRRRKRAWLAGWEERRYRVKFNPRESGP